MRPPPKETVELTISPYPNSHGPHTEADRTIPFADNREQGLHLRCVRDALALGSGQLRSIRDGGLDDELSPAQDDAIDIQIVSGTEGLVAHEVASASDDLEIVPSRRLR